MVFKAVLILASVTLKISHLQILFVDINIYHQIIEDKKVKKKGIANNRINSFNLYELKIFPKKGKLYVVMKKIALFLVCYFSLVNGKGIIFYNSF